MRRAAAGAGERIHFPSGYAAAADLVAVSC